MELAFIIVAFVFAFAGYKIGYEHAKKPDEAKMIERLVEIRAQRLRAARAREDVEAAVDEAAARRA